MDAVLGAIGLALVLLLVTSTIPGKFYIAIGVAAVFIVLLLRLDAEPTYVYLLHVIRHFGLTRSYEKDYTDEELKLFKEQGREEAAKTIYKKGRKFAKEEDIDDKDDPKDKKARIKAEKEERRRDDKILKSKTATKEEKDAIWLKRAQQSAEKKKAKGSAKSQAATDNAHSMSEIMAFTGIHDNLIDYAGQYYGAVIEIPPVEFRFFSAHRRDNSIENGVGAVLRSVSPNFATNIVKVERPVLYDGYLDNEYKKLDDLRAAYEQNLVTEAEMKARVEVLYDRINELRNLCFEDKVLEPFYYLVLFDSDRQQLNNMVNQAMDSLRTGELKPKRLDDRDIAVFLKYTNAIDFDEREIDNIAPEDYAAWAMPQSLRVKARTIQVNNIITHNFRVVNYPVLVDDAWLASVMTIPATKVVVKCTPMDRGKAIRGIDRSLQELRGQWGTTSVDSKRLELEEHIATLSTLLSTLQGENEQLLEVSIYVTAYDIHQTRNTPEIPQPAPSLLTNISNMKKLVRRTYQEKSLRLNNMEFDQVEAFVGGQVSGWDPMRKQGRGIPSNTIAAAYPWVFSHVADAKGIKLGSESGVPVFIDFFRRDSERVNSNMVIIGKSGSGKSYATKSLLTNLAADDSKIFILDPENEYADLAQNLHGKFINVGNAKYGRLNPFQIITALDDDESGEDAESSGSYSTHLQFLEEFFRQILPDCDKDAMEYLNALIDQMYANRDITAETDLSTLRPEDYPIFDDLYDCILTEFQASDNEYIRTMLRTLLNYVEKFATGGRNATLWNGPSTVTTEENFTVFNFQSLLSNRNGTVANAQMLLVLKYIDNEIIKNREYNKKYNLSRKVVVVIDEAHVFIDNKYPVALDFMFQLAKRIRKYNGMQIVITQNIKDFVGSEEIARKSTAIINACQYSFVFALAPNDMSDLVKLYEKAGGINENEQEQIMNAQRGQAFTIMSPQSRSSFKVEVPEDVVAMFQDPDFVSRYFVGEEGEKNWEDFVGESRQIHEQKVAEAVKAKREAAVETGRSRVTLMEVTQEELDASAAEAAQRASRKKGSSAAAMELASQKRGVTRFEVDLDEGEEDTLQNEAGQLDLEDEDFFDLDDIPEIPEDPEEFKRMMESGELGGVEEAVAPEIEESEEESLGTSQTISSEDATESAPAEYVSQEDQEDRVLPREPRGRELSFKNMSNAANLQNAAAYSMPPIVVQAPESTGALEKVVERLGEVVENVSKFNYESVLGEVRRMIAQSGAGMMGTQGAAMAQMATEGAGIGGGVSMGSIFNADALEEAARLNEEEAERARLAEEDRNALRSSISMEEDTSDADEFFDLSGFDEGILNADEVDDGFDFMALLAEQADEMEDTSPIEMMSEFGEDTIEISLEDLIAYNKKHSA